MMLRISSSILLILAALVLLVLALARVLVDLLERAPYEAPVDEDGQFTLRQRHVADGGGEASAAECGESSG